MFLKVKMCLHSNFEQQSENLPFTDYLWTVTQLIPKWQIVVYVFKKCTELQSSAFPPHVCMLSLSTVYVRFPRCSR